MLRSLIVELGPWNWIALGLLLLVLEILAPGVFLLWIGIAALIVGVLTLALGQAAFWTWQVQVVVFLVLALISAYGGKQVMARRSNSDQPLLNRRPEQLIGRTATLKEPIRDGYGRIQLGDTLWRVCGPDLPVGVQVRVVSVRDSELVVAAA